jgi:hypothetical protein
MSRATMATAVRGPPGASRTAQGRSGVRQANERETGRVDMRDAHRLVGEHDEIGAGLDRRRQHVLPLRRGSTECDVLDRPDEPRRRRAGQSQTVHLPAYPSDFTRGTGKAIDVVEQAHVALSKDVPLGAYATRIIRVDPLHPITADQLRVAPAQDLAKERVDVDDLSARVCQKNTNRRGLCHEAEPRLAFAPGLVGADAGGYVARLKRRPASHGDHGDVVDATGRRAKAFYNLGSVLLGDALEDRAERRRIEFGDGSADESLGRTSECFRGRSVGINEAPRVIDYYDCVARGIEERRDGLEYLIHVSLHR